MGFYDYLKKGKEYFGVGKAGLGQFGSDVQNVRANPKTIAKGIGVGLAKTGADFAGALNRATTSNIGRKAINVASYIPMTSGLAASSRLIGQVAKPVQRGLNKIVKNNPANDAAGRFGRFIGENAAYAAIPSAKIPKFIRAASPAARLAASSLIRGTEGAAVSSAQRYGKGEDVKKIAKDIPGTILAGGIVNTGMSLGLAKKAGSQLKTNLKSNIAEQSAQRDINNIAYDISRTFNTKSVKEILQKTTLSKSLRPSQLQRLSEQLRDVDSPITALRIIREFTPQEIKNTLKVNNYYKPGTSPGFASPTGTGRGDIIPSPTATTKQTKGIELKAQEKNLPLQPSTKNQGDLPISQSELSTQKTQSPLDQGLQTSKLNQEQSLQVQSFDNTLPQNTRSFKETVRNSSLTSPELRERVTSDLYKTRNTQELTVKAKNFVNDYPDISRDLAYSSKHDDKTVAIAQELIKKFQAEGRIDEALDLVDDLAPKLTEVGRTAQIVSAYGKLTPDGVLRFAQREINKAMQLRPDLKIKITNEKATKLLDLSSRIQKMPDGYEKTLATQKMLKEIYDVIPPTLVQKIATFQTMAQLLNPKTAIRNLGGNLGFSGLENTSQTLATPIDALMSIFTGKRTIALPSLKTQSKGFVGGIKEGTREVMAGVNTLNASSQFDLPKVPVFRNKLLAAAEKAMGVELRATDRGFYKAAFDDSIRSQMRALKSDKVTSEMMEIAHLDGLYRTFQDETTLTKVFQGLKNVLNYIGIKDGNDKFGLGDFILKYPKTPASIISKGIDYSPGGIAKALFEVGKGVTGRGFDQRKFVMSLSRGTVGTAGLVGTGALLGSLGIITEAPNKDKDVRGIQKSVGLGSYQINVSALKRFVFSGLNKDTAKLRQGDMLVSYDWAQPMAIGLTMGAKMANEKKIIDANVAKSGIESLNAGVETLAEQPLVSGIRDIAQGNKPIGDVIVDTAKKAPSSFIPTLSNQVGQLTDNTSRMTYNPNPASESINMVKGRIPILRNTLPERTDVFGQTQEQYQNGSNNFFNVFLNPAFVTKYKPTPEAQEVLRLMETTGETSQIPRVQNYKVKVNGENVSLSPQQINEMQRYIGTRTQSILSNLEGSQSYQILSDEDKVKKITNLLSDISVAAKISILGDQPKKIGSGTKAILGGGYSFGGGNSFSKKDVQLSILSNQLQQDPNNKSILAAMQQVATGRKPKKLRIAKPKKVTAKKIKFRTTKPAPIKKLSLKVKKPKLTKKLA